MMRPQRGRKPLVLLLHCCWFLATKAAKEGVCEAQPDGSCVESCQLYLAPSTIPNAGLGLFTAKPLEQDDEIRNSDVAIPIIEKYWRSGENCSSPFDTYVWEGWYMGMQRESEEEDPEAVCGFCPGIDGAINCNTALINVGHSFPKYDTAGVHRSRDAGAGASTPYHGTFVFCTAPVPAGGELFKDYGDSFFLMKPYMGPIPLRGDFYSAEEYAGDFVEFALSEQAMHALWDIVATMPWESRLYNAFPKTAEEAFKVAREGIRSLHQPSATRSIDFLKEHGRCMDNIHPRQSTIPGAGHGAFATRFLPQGSIVTGSPHLHIAYRTDLDMYGEGPDRPFIGKQLLLNYCYGHAQSTLLLCPYGIGVGFINHHGQKANVKIQWAPHGMIRQNDDFFTKQIPDLDLDVEIGLAFDFVATRDILSGEELFLDYGTEWEEAWESHVENWEPMEGTEDYITSQEMNDKTRGQPLRTHLEQETEPYPDNLEILCHRSYEDTEYMEELEEWAASEWGLECDILDRVETNDGFVYTVKVLEYGREIVTTVPRGALSFQDLPYTTDMHLMNAFRHEIMIPDEMFPETWKNQRELNVDL